MLVFGDARRIEATFDLLDRIRKRLADAAEGEGEARRDGLVAVLIEAGCLAQGLADHGFRERGGVDDVDPVADAALELTRRVAGAVVRADADPSPLRGGPSRRAAPPGAGVGQEAPLALNPAPPPPGSACGRVRPPRKGEGSAAWLSAITTLTARPLPPTVEISEPEGFAHYTVYPEAFARAARLVPDGPVCVVGVRSIGTTLAACVAAARPEVSGLFTLRPTGHPFDRRSEVGPALGARLSAHAGGRFVIVDEGPGLSGSSMASVVRLLENLGVEPGRIHLIPSHSGEPGPKASVATLQVWRRAPRHVVTFDDMALAPDATEGLGCWFVDLIGPAVEPPLDLSGGAWRKVAGLPKSRWPPVHGWQERRKFLLRTRTGTWLARFVGLGEIGEAKHSLARRLADAGFVNEPVGLRRGFVLERWLDDAVADPPDWAGPERIAHLGAYLAERARIPARGSRRGASVAVLHEMLRVNATEALGPGAGEVAESWSGRIAGLEARRWPVLTDNRLHRWEWLRAGGRILKADALDHHAGHDLVGPQDIAWDVAGAAVEFALREDEAAELAGIVEERSGTPVDHELVAFMRDAYAAFQLGYFVDARDGAGGAERERLAASAELYRAILADRP